MATVTAGPNRLRIRGVPASFDPVSLGVQLDGATLKEIVIRVPNRQQVERDLAREATVARRLIDTSVGIGARRAPILQMCDELSQRSYLDEEIELTLWVDALRAGTLGVSLSYFINDERFAWKPTMTVELGEDGTARLRGHIAITNDSAFRLDDVEVSFADFARDSSVEARSYRVAPDELRTQMKQQVLKKMVFK